MIKSRFQTLWIYCGGPSHPTLRPHSQIFSHFLIPTFYAVGTSLFDIQWSQLVKRCLQQSCEKHSLTRLSEATARRLIYPCGTAAQPSHFQVWQRCIIVVVLSVFLSGRSWVSSYADSPSALCQKQCGKKDQKHANGERLACFCRRSGQGTDYFSYFTLI